MRTSKVNQSSTVHLSDLSLNMLNELVRLRHQEPTKLVEAAIISMFEDEMDISLVEQSRKESEGSPTKSLEQVRKDLGLDH